jgi:hypothetical protein
MGCVGRRAAQCRQQRLHKQRQQQQAREISATDELK